MDTNGLVATVTKGRGDNQTTELRWIAGPFEILGRVRDPSSEGWARLLRWSDDDNRVHSHAVSDADLHGDISALSANLASRGLRITTGSDRSHFVRYLNEVDVKNRVTVVPTTGWHDIGLAKVFALPDQIIGSVAGETVIVQGAITSPFERCGTLPNGSMALDRSSPDIHDRHLPSRLPWLAPCLDCSVWKVAGSIFTASRAR